ncbi:O-methyltransferase [Achaetomium macrosporum]|uniref:O-methyltransferase n=1 Tax=Achaetomium macrosporum TaxID=79813 RepID=A0AAN7CJC3_9PEZI|nr:O-methyltransferase [Achaetomium macrosporum]
MSTSRIVQLAESVARNTKVLNSYLRDHKLPLPSFEADGPVDLGISADAPHVEQARTEAIEAAAELVDLLQGPWVALRPITSGISLHAISRWDIATKVPLKGETTFASLAQQCRVREVDMRRILRYAMAHHRLFREPRPGVVVHSLASRLLVEEPLLRDGLWLLGEQHFAAGPYAVPALEKWGAEEEQGLSHVPFCLAIGPDKSTFEWFETDPKGREWAPRFARAMTSFGLLWNRPAAAQRVGGPLDAYPWAALGRCTVVDVGGSRGHDAIYLAQRYPELSLVVQDLPAMIEGGEEAVPAELRDRVRFMPHSFLTPQTLAADVYLIKHCLHNWPDYQCVRILRNQIPALRPGVRVIVLDGLMPPPGKMSLMTERNVRAYDMVMLAGCPGREREEDDWRRIFKEADERFKVQRIQPAPAEGELGPAPGLIEVVWEG